MRIGFIVPTEFESVNLPELNSHVTCAGVGAGKAAGCAAAAKLIFDKHCDTIIIWGLAGALSNRVHVGDIVVASQVAYRDFNIAPLSNSTGVGYVADFAENVFVGLDKNLHSLLTAELKKIFPDRNVMDGIACSGDQFTQFAPGEERNRVEAKADTVDMESAAVAHFCHLIDPKIKVGIIRIVSDNADHNANIDFTAFLNSFAQMNGKLFELRQALLADSDNSEITSAIIDYPDFPVKGVLFRDIWGIICDQEIFNSACNKLFDLFNTKYPNAGITKIAGIESRGFIFGFELAKIFGVPFVPLRKKGKLPGEVVADTYQTEYSESCLEGQKSAFTDDDNVLLVDDIIATGGSLLAARNVIIKCGAKCRHTLALGLIDGLKGVELLESFGITATCLLKL